MGSRSRAARLLVIAVDCSTTAVKAVVLDQSGSVVASAVQPLSLSAPHPGWYEQSAAEWLRGLDVSVGLALANLPDRQNVRALCITHQRESFVCVDRSGNPLRPAILWMDCRASVEIASLGSPEVHSLSGKPPDVTPSLYKIAWLSRHEPGVLSSAYKVMETHAYLVRHLTHETMTSSGSADALGLFDLKHRSYSLALVEMAGMAPAQLVDTVEPGTVIGNVDPSYLSNWGLRAPLPVIAGIGDGQAAGLGAAAVRPGRGYLNLGTAAVLGTESRAYLWGGSFRTLIASSPHRFCLETLLSSGSFMTDWFRKSFKPDMSFEGLESSAAHISPGSDGLLSVPYWNGAQTPHWDPTARGAIVGWRGIHTPAHMYRSILEGVAFELRCHLEGLESATGTPLQDIRMMGGGARSKLWVQILADVLGRPITVCSAEEVSALGAGVLAMAGVQGATTTDLAEIAEQIFSAERQQQPEPSNSETYDELFDVHRDIYPRFRPILQKLDRIEPDLVAKGPHIA